MVTLFFSKRPSKITKRIGQRLCEKILDYVAFQFFITKERAVDEGFRHCSNFCDHAAYEILIGFYNILLLNGWRMD